jgi:toxin ParE1/3/4
MLAIRISLDARTDIIDILNYTERRFGASGRRRYQGLLQAALKSLSNEPERIGSTSRDEIAPGLRSLHLFFCRGEASTGRVIKPRHVVIYRYSEQAVEIVRILHEAMELERHLPMK